jgi:hypothetical protein
MSQLRQQPELRATRSAPQHSDDSAGFENERAFRNPASAAAQRGLYAERPAFAQPTPAAQPGAAMRGRSAGAGMSGAQGLGGDFAAIEAGLRGSLQPDYHTAQDPYAEQHQAHDPQMDDDDDWLDAAQASEPPDFAAQYGEQPRSRRLLYVSAAIIAVGITGIGATFALKRTPAAPHQIAMIKAATAPAKVRAPAPVQSASAKAAIQDASVLETTPQPPPVGIVNRTEQPVALPEPTSAPANAASAQSVPVPPPPAVAEAPQAAHAQPSQTGVGGTQVASTSKQAFGLAGLIQPRMVKTVAVRPDGTIIRDDGSVQNPPDSTGSTQTASAEAAPAAATPAQAAATGGEAAPALPIAAEPPPASHAAPSHSSHVSVADRGNDEADDATVSHASGTYAVQLTARATEAEARHALQELARKYGSILGTRHLKFHRAKVNGKSVFRVRVSDLSRDSANMLCKKLQAKGGSCFVARDRS